MNKSWKIPRRTFLKGIGGVGVSLMLPQLDIMEAEAATASPRFVAVFNNLGVYGYGYDGSKNSPERYYNAAPWDNEGMGVWVPRATGPFVAPLPPVLAPLENLKSKISILSGLGTLPGDAINTLVNHSGATTAWLTSAWDSTRQMVQTNLTADGKSMTAANNTPPDSLDQVIANFLGISPGSSLVLSPNGKNYSEGATGGHGGYISYNSKLASGGSTLVPKVTDPMKAFNNLFSVCNASAPKISTGQKSVLDFVMNGITKLQKKASPEDKVRLQSYFQHIRDLEVRLSSTAQTCPPAPTGIRPYDGGALDWVTTVFLMADVIALAVATGKMPVATLMTDMEAYVDLGYSQRVKFLSNYVGINGNKVAFSRDTTDIHFEIAHVDVPSNYLEVEQHIAYSQMNTCVSQRLLEKLNSMPLEPNGFSPLDNTLVLVGACHNHSGLHGTHNLPTLLAGGKAFGLNQGRHQRFAQNTDIGNLYYTIMKAMGVSGSSFNGRSTLLSGVFS